MTDDEVVRKIFPLYSQAIRTNLPVFLLQKLEDCLTAQITEADIVGLGAPSWPDTVLTALASPIVAPFHALQSLTDLPQSFGALFSVLFK